MNSIPGAKQGLLAQILRRIRRLEKAKLCEVVGGLAEPSNFLAVFSTISCELVVCLEGPLPIDSLTNHQAAADGPGQSFDAHLPLKEYLCSVVPMVPQMENWMNRPVGWFESSDSWEGECSK